MYNRIKFLREKNSISIEEISNYLNISSTLYIKYETGKKEIPIQILSKLSRKYNTSIDYIVEETDSIIAHTKNN